MKEQRVTSKHPKILSGKNRRKRVEYKTVTGRHRFRIAVFDILTAWRPLSLIQLRELVIESQWLDLKKVTERDLTKRLHNALVENPRVFRRTNNLGARHGQLNVKWELIPGATFNDRIVRAVRRPKKRRMPCPQRDALYVVLSSRRCYCGWSLDELADASVLKRAGYKIKRGTNKRRLKDDLAHHLGKKHEDRFEKVGKDHDARWRVKKPKRPRRPRSHEDWNALLQDVAAEGELPKEFGNLVRLAKICGPFYGWNTMAVASFFENQMALALQRASL